MPKAKPASKPKKPTKIAVPAVSDDIDGRTGLTIQGAELVFVPGTPEDTGRTRDEPATISEDSAPFPAETDGPAGIGYLVRWPEKTEAEDAGSKTATTAVPTSFPTDTNSSRQTTEQTETNAGDGSDTREASATPLATAGDPEKNVGGVAFLETSSDSNNVDKSDIIDLSSRVSRLPGEGRSGCHERLRRLARASGMPRGQGPGTAYNWALEQTNILFAKLAEPIAEDPPPAEPIPEEVILPNFGKTADPEPPSIAVAPAPIQDDQGVSGLGDLPPGWPELPANAQLQVEIAWVTANRLRVRDGTGVNLSKALSPAPSYSALSWLETSILFPAKFADISVKATASQDDEKEFIKREKLAIAEIRSILAEMLDAKD